MSEDYEFSDDTTMMRMEEDGEANSDDPMSAAGDCGLMGGEAEGSRIDASKNEEDEGYVGARLILHLKSISTIEHILPTRMIT